MRTYIWTLPTRLFHWLLAISFAVTYITGEEEEYLGLHSALGSFIGVLIIFRIIQGFTGPKYARFRDFPVSLSSISNFITRIRQNKTANGGHNPLASVIMLAIIITALTATISGMLIFATGETGIFGLRFTPGFDPEIFGEFHKIVAVLFLILVGIHFTGILADSILHRADGTIFSIFTGYKNIQAEEARLSSSQKIFSVLWFALPLLMFFYILNYQPIPTNEKETIEKVNETNEDDD